jgi:hypothetical protein
MQPFNIVTKASDGTHFGVGFDRPVEVHRLARGPARPSADYVFDHRVPQGSFRIENNPLNLVHLDGPPLSVRLGPNRVLQTIPVGYELPVSWTPVEIELGDTVMFVNSGEFVPKWEILLDIAQSEKLAPCGLDKSALGGPEALLAVARNPNLTPDQCYRWAQCPWAPLLQTLAANPSCPPELRASIRNAVQPRG